MSVPCHVGPDPPPSSRHTAPVFAAVLGGQCACWLPPPQVAQPAHCCPAFIHAPNYILCPLFLLELACAPEKLGLTVGHPLGGDKRQQGREASVNSR